MNDIKGSSKEGKKNDFPFISPLTGAIPGSISPASANLAQM